MKRVAALIALISTSTAAGATPSQGVPLKVRRGFFTETDAGVFFDVGGSKGYSLGSLHLQLGVGYQLTLNEGKGLIPIGFHVAIAPNADNCWAGLNEKMECLSASNFTLTMPNLTAGYLHQIFERLYLGGKAIGGVALVDPRPIPDPRDPTNHSLLVAPLVGAAASLEYATNMDHLSIGLDLAYRLIVGPNIQALMAYARVQYTF